LTRDSGVAYMDENQPLSMKSLLLVLMLCTLWGGLVVSVKVGLQGVPPILLAALRFGVALVTIYVWTRLVGRSLYVAPGDRLIIVMPALILVAMILFLNFGTGYTSGSHAVLFMQTYPLFVAAISHYLIQGDQLNLKKGVGLIIAGLGMSLTIYDEMDGAASPLGDVLVLLSSLFLAIQIMMNKVLVRRIAPVSVIFWQQVIVFPVFSVLWVFLEWDMPVKLSPSIIAAIVYQGAVVAGFCFLVWIRLLQRHSATQISSFFFTTPLFGVILSWLILGDTVTPYLSAGMVLLAVGLWAVNRPN